MFVRCVIFKLRVDLLIPRCFFSSFSLVAMSRRLYLGSMYPYPCSWSMLKVAMTIELPPDTRSEDVSKFFDGYGKIVDCRVMTGQLSSFTFSHPSDA